MMTIWKYPFDIKDEITIEMPEFSDVLSVQVQDGVPCIWARVDPDSRKIKWTFYLYGTGHKLKFSNNYHGTFQLNGYVWHLFT